MNTAQSMKDTFHLIMLSPMYAYITELIPIVGVLVNSMAVTAMEYAFAISSGDGRMRQRARALAAKWNKLAW